MTTTTFTWPTFPSSGDSQQLWASLPTDISASIGLIGTDYITDAIIDSAVAWGSDVNNTNEDCDSV